MSHASYIKRIFSAYVLGKNSQLSFWHETPEINPADYSDPESFGCYYMKFRQKAGYSACLDEKGIPLLDYHGSIGLQYNPIAIAQYGLAHGNLYMENKHQIHLDRVVSVADWLSENLEPNLKGLMVWHHKFDFEYSSLLKNPWYSGLAQGQGISLLLRAYHFTGRPEYMGAAKSAYQSFLTEIRDGGVIYRDENGRLWIEEYLTPGPTHILNGFIWALWGIYDYHRLTKDSGSLDLFNRMTETLLANLSNYDTGFWSMYDISGKRMRNLASPFYHRLHIIQLDVMHRLTGCRVFEEFRNKWTDYQIRLYNRCFSFMHKSLFKLVYY